MHAYHVGARYHPERAHWPETVTLDWRGDAGPVLLLFFRRPSVAEIRAVAQGPAEFGVVWQSPVLALLARYGDLPWNDAPFTIHRVPVGGRPALPLPSFAPGQGVALTTMLIDAATGIIRAIRLTGLDTRVSQVMADALAAQADAPYDADAYDAAVDALYRRYPDSAALVRAAAARCRVSGDPRGE